MEDAAQHRGLEVRAYATKGPWRRKDLALVAAMGPVFLSVGWQTARFVGLLAGVGATVALGALVLLLEFWLVEFYCWARLDVRQDPSNAELCVVKPRHAQTRRAHKCKLTACEDSGEVSFSFWNARYVLDKKSGSFERLTNRVEGTRFADHLRAPGIASARGLRDGIRKWGANEFAFSKPEFLPLLVEHMLAPFFVFQLFCVGLWCLDEYWYYSLFTLVMLVMFECTVVKQRIRNLETLQQMGHQPQAIWTFREGQWQRVSEHTLIPGDLISISSESGFAETFVPADCLLLAGTGITNESILTGESVPQWKVSVKFRSPKDGFSWRRDKQHVLFRGTTLIQHDEDGVSHLSPLSRQKGSPDGGLVCLVLRTGFGTTQGDLMRTILHSTERMSANSSEAGLFILFLLVFAVAASAYVLYNGIYLTAPEDRDPFKLALNCIMIITSVIPPELPMELSLAVNTSMLSLFKKFIFCTEPFRIPLAGKVDACCFDKTGTLTSTRLVFEGVGDPRRDMSDLGGVPEIEVPKDPACDATKVLVGCHSLVAVDGKLRGDPMEKAAFKALLWTISKDLAKPKKGNPHLRGGDRYMLKILKRFHFNPTLKRMSTIVLKRAMEPSAPEAAGGSSAGEYLILAKGAPESLRESFSRVPDDYDEVYLDYARRGLRVIALGIRRLQISDPLVVRGLSRSQAESSLEFCGFATFSCPLKPSSSETLLSLKQASHRLVMITGDAMLTACHVAREVHIADKPPLILKEAGRATGAASTAEAIESAFEWATHDGTTDIAFGLSTAMELSRDYSLCVPGKVVTLLAGLGPSALRQVLPFCSVFARTSPDDKEVIVKTLKDVGHTVLMCGDGTNDVGALKTAHVGIALLNSVKPAAPRRRRKKTIREWVEEEEDDSLPVVSLGDASIASPFTSRFSTVTPCVDIVKQGRSTLVTYVQMFKILGINCLSSAYSMSVMYLNGVKMGDTQATVSGVIIALLFMSLSNTSANEKLSAARPHSKVFCRYFMVSMVGQFFFHFAYLYGTYRYALTFAGDDVAAAPEAVPAGAPGNSTEADPASGASEKEAGGFEPNLVNTVAFTVNFVIQLATFAVNYVGEPFNVNIWRNRGLAVGLVACVALTGLLISGAGGPDLDSTFEVVALPEELKVAIALGGLGTWIAALCVETAARRLFPERLHKNLLL